MLEHEVFSVGAVPGCGIEVTDDTVHGGEYFVVRPSPPVPFDGVEVEPFVEFVSVVAHAPEGARGKGFVGSRFLEKCGVAHSLGKGRVGGGPGKMEGWFVPEEGEGEKEGELEEGVVSVTSDAVVSL